MMSNQPSIFQVILRLIAGRPLALIDFLFDVIQRLPLVRSLPGMYEVLDFHAELELRDSKGRTAVYAKTQKVRFIQDNIIAYQDTAWGDGEIFADYQCSPGREVDRYEEGDRYNILISLRETRNRDDTETLHIRREIQDGFVRQTESFQIDIDHRTHHLTVGVIFPKSRLPEKVSLVERNRKRTLTLDQTHRQILPDGRHRYQWETKDPKLFETFILQWVW